MVLGMAMSRDVPDNQYGKGPLVGIAFTTMDLLSHWPQGYGTFNFLAQTELLFSGLLGQTKLIRDLTQTHLLFHLSQITQGMFNWKYLL